MRDLYISVQRIVTICGQQNEVKMADGPKNAVVDFDQNNEADSIVRSLPRNGNEVRADQLSSKAIRMNIHWL